MNKYQFKTKTPSGLGNVYYYCYADDRFETYLNIKNIKYKKNWKNQGKNEFEQLQQELQRKDNNWNELKTYIQMNINATCNMNNDNYNEGRYKAYCDILDKINELEERK